MPEIEIRPTVAADLPVLSHLEHSYTTQYVWQMERLIEEGQISVGFREVRLPRSVRVEYPRAAELTQQLWPQKQTCLTATIGSVPVGYMRLEDQFSASTVWITDVVVGEKVRRKGIASALLLAAQQWAVQRNLRRVVLAMQSKNHPGIQLANKLGYEFCGFNDHYYVNQDIALFFARYVR
ncbi:MAG: GNAT family N-acetyltransferase [Chloroflexi bacterium]|nr:GNAT family N-acetyltransferase [Chloroflexota bacterium]